MLKIHTVQKSEDLLELAQESPYPMAKRALEAIKNGKNEEAAQILEEHLKNLDTDQELLLWKYITELMELVTLWLYKPEKEGVWLTRIDKIREEIAIISFQQARFDKKYFQIQVAQRWDFVQELVKIEIPSLDFSLPSFEAIFETEYDWEILKQKKDE